jgi:hypothetical protein
MKNFGFYLIATLAAVSCKTIEIEYERTAPEFTTVNRLLTLTEGMSKEEVLQNIEVYPYDIYYNEENNCEVHVVKYAKTERVAPDNISRGTDDQTVKGQEVYDNIEDMLVIYRDGKFNALISDSHADEAYELAWYNQMLKDACSGVIRGCMDTKSLSYNPQATVDDGSCTYCDCGFVKAIHETPEDKAKCPPCIPSDELIAFWILDQNCTEIRKWLTLYPDLIRKIPNNFFDKCNDRSNEDCNWCEVLSKAQNTPSSITLNLK